ncbi:hypothetical protein MNBD_BACTEROID01-590 [hydrothermal vent metagenome]|uniref:Cytochrome c-552/4 domain-containing protein n=1 Tax=hydrothermal vent metagenome TaxID=652676 RepID=A0A3B0TMH5_9ZZZZ
MPKHILRLIILFMIVIGLFLVARHFLIPESFGKYGYYRADSIEENADHDIKYVDRAECAACHDDIAALKQGGPHKNINCQTCHGPGNLHIEDPTPENILKETERELCGRCHNKNAARPKFIKQIDINEHNIESKCIECHNPHEPWN